MHLSVQSCHGANGLYNEAGTGEDFGGVAWKTIENAWLTIVVIVRISSCIRLRQRLDDDLVGKKAGFGGFGRMI
jgi:hypothetical protein